MAIPFTDRSMPSVAMIEGNPEEGHDDAVDEADAEPHRIESGNGHPRPAGVTAGDHRGADHGQRHDRAHRQVETAGHEHEHLPGGQDRQRRRTAEKVEEAGRLEIGRLLQGHRGVEHDEDDQPDVDAGRGTVALRARLPFLQRDRHATCPLLRAA